MHFAEIKINIGANLGRVKVKAIMVLALSLQSTRDLSCENCVYQSRGTAML